MAQSSHPLFNPEQILCYPFHIHSAVKFYQHILVVQSLDPEWHHPQLLVHYQCNQPTLCSGLLMASWVATGILVSTINQRVSNVHTYGSSCLGGDLTGYDKLPCGHRHDHTTHILRPKRTHRSQWDHLVWVWLLNQHDSPCLQFLQCFPMI